jgi:hypothetical protein
MSRRRTSDTLPFDTLRLEGSLFVPELLERAARGGAMAQKETDYDIPKGLKLHDEYGRAFRIAGALWQDFAAQRPRADLNATTFTRRFVIDLLRQTLDYDDLSALSEPVVIGDRGFPVTAQALGGRLPVIIAPHHLGLDDPDPAFAIHGSGAKKKSTHQLAQEYLNATPSALWAIVSNGRSLRLLRDAETLTRPNFLEFDLETILGEGEDRYADYSALWRILHASRAGEADSTPAECVWEQWKGEGHAQGLRVREGLRVGVTQALLVLGSGFVAHPDNKVFRDRLGDGTLTTDAFFQQLLRLVYRWLFLFCAEERELLHAPLPDDPQESESARTAREAYARGYGLRRLRSRSLRRLAHDPHGDLWISLRIAFRSLASGEPRLALPALGGLFADSQCPDIDASSLSNRDLLAAMRELRWFFDKKSGRRSAIDYRNMGPEELGSVYESLLELVPQLDLPARTFGFVGISDEGSTSGNARKTSGSYYTPDSLVQELIKSALEPVIRQRLAEARALADQPWSSVVREIEADPVKHGYVRAYLEKQAGLAAGAPLDALGRAWEAIPAVARANPLCAEALLALTVCDPSCGSGHFLLAAARRLAERLAELRAPDGAVRPDDYRHALREVASRCLYGVDINPMAVELCRVALWLETVDPGKPLGFLNHHIRCGNSLLGTTPELIAEGLPDDTFKAIEGDDKTACAELKKRNKKEREGFGPLFEKEEQSIRDRLRQAATQIEAMDDSRPDALHRKEVAFATNETSPETRHAKLLADLWCAAFVIKKRYPQDDEAHPAQVPISDLPSPIEGELLTTEDDLFGQPVSLPLVSKKSVPPKTKNPNQGAAIGITTGTLRDFVRGKELPAEIQGEVEALARQYRFFHWHLAFPQVFAHGGFDCILGNPPWDMQEIKDNEFFASEYPQILAVTSAKEKAGILRTIAAEQPELWKSYDRYCRTINGETHLIMESGRFPHSASGRLNLYRLFVESSCTVVSTTGRIGMVFPSGFASDAFAQAHFRSLFDVGRIHSFWDFENREGLFPGVHRSYRFSAVTIRGDARAGAKTDFVFFAHSVEDVHDEDRHVALSHDDLTGINPISGTPPQFRTAREFAITALIHSRSAILCPEPPNASWGVKTKLMFMMNASMKTHRTAEELIAKNLQMRGNRFVGDSSEWLPFYEGKMVGMFDHRAASVVFDPTNRVRRNQADAVSGGQHEDPEFSATPVFWLDSSEVTSRCGDAPRWFIAVKDVTSATNERTVIGTILPPSALTDSVPWLSGTITGTDAASLLASLLSFACDFVARQKVNGLHLRGHYLNQLPVLPPATYARPCPWANHPQSKICNPQSLRDWLLPRVLELTYTAWDLEPFAQDCGWPGPPFRWDEERRFLLRCELDAAFFHIYLGSATEWQQRPEALTRAFPTPRDAVSYIMDTFPIVKRKDEAKHRSYRTKDTILEIYDALGEAMGTGVPYRTRLDPPPADPACCHPAKI